MTGAEGEMRPMSLDQNGAEDSTDLSTGTARSAASATKVAPLASTDCPPEALGMATVTARPGGHSAQPDPELDAAGDDLRARLDVISNRFAWDGRRLVIHHEPTLTRLTQRTMSASTMHAMDGCTARWAFEKVWPGDQDPFAPSVLGNGGHKVLERLFELPGRDRTMPAAMTILRQVCNDAMPGDDPLTTAVRDRWMAEVYAGFKGIFDIEDTTRVDVYGRELEVRATIAGVPFVGFVDRVDRLPSDALCVVDFKSSRSLPKNIKVFGDEHGDQQRLYLLAMEQQLGQRPESAWLYYTRLGQAKKVAVARARVTETRDKFLVAAEKLALIGDTASMTPATSALCGWCPLVNVCPSAKAEEKADRTDKAVLAAWLPIPTIGEPGVATTVPPPPERTQANVDGRAGRVSESAGSAHVEDEQFDAEPQGATVTRLKEGQPYIELSDGDLNPNSYASMAATDVVEMAVFTLDKAGVPLTRAGVQSLAAMYASVIADVQKPVTGSASMQDGMNSRARFLVKRILRTLPTPVHATAVAEWDSWAEAVVKRARLMWTVAYSLWSDGPDDPTKIADEVFAAVVEAKRKLPAAKAAQAQDTNNPVEPAFDEAPDATATSEPARRHVVVSETDTTVHSDDEGGFGDFDL